MTAPGINLVTLTHEPLWLQRVKDAGFVHARFDGLPTAEECRDACQRILDAGLVPLIIVRTAQQCELLPPGTLVEWWNEGDLNGWNGGQIPEMWRVIARCDERQMKCYVGASPSGLHHRGFNLLEKFPWASIPLHVGCSFHRYGEGDPRQVTKWDAWFFNRPPNPWKTPADEMHHLQTLVGARPLALTEFGKCSARFTPEAQCDAMRYYREFYSQWCEVIAAYQVRDAPLSAPQSCENTYGGWTADGVEKTWVRAFTSGEE